MAKLLPQSLKLPPERGRRRYAMPFVWCLMYGYMVALPGIILIAFARTWYKYSDTVAASQIVMNFLKIFTDPLTLVEIAFYVAMPALLGGVNTSLMIFWYDRKKDKEQRALESLRDGSPLSRG